MSKIIDWIIFRMRPVDSEEEQEEPAQEMMLIEKSWLELIHWKKEKVREEDCREFFKTAQSFVDCKLVIDDYEKGAVCIYRLEPTQNSDAQGIMNYICGAL